MNKTESKLVSLTGVRCSFFQSTVALPSNEELASSRASDAPVGLRPRDSLATHSSSSFDNQFIDRGGIVPTRDHKDRRDTAKNATALNVYRCAGAPVARLIFRI